MEITDKEIKAFWRRYDLIIIAWNLVSFFFILSAVSFFVSLVIWAVDYDHWLWFLGLGLIIPINIVLKYVLGVKNLWLFNDTKDGDFGDPEEIKKAGYEKKSKLFIVIWWWFRNHSWNFIKKYNPTWYSGKVDEFLIIATTLTEEQILKDRFTWCTIEGVHGLHYIAYRIDGIVYCRYSRADKDYEIIMGSGGDRYKLKMRGKWIRNLLKRYEV